MPRRRSTFAARSVHKSWLQLALIRATITNNHTLPSRNQTNRQPFRDHGAAELWARDHPQRRLPSKSQKRRALSFARKGPTASRVSPRVASTTVRTTRHHAGRNLARPEYCLCHVTHRFDVLLDALKADDPARTGLKPFIAPRESADDGTLVQHQLNVAADVFRVNEPLLKCLRVEGKIILHNLSARALVRVRVLSEEVVAAHADLSLKLLGEVRPHASDRGVHRMVAGTAINSEPFDFLLQHPVEKLLLAARVHTEVLHQILLRFALPIAVPAGMDDKDVSVLYFNGRALDHFGRND